MTDTQERNHEDWLDDVAVYALGSLPMQDADRVRAHIATCETCRREYAELQPVTSALAGSAEACLPGTGAITVSPLLKARIMRTVRGEAGVAARSAVERPADSVRPSRERPAVWPAYLVAAACLAIALISSVSDITLSGQLKQSQAELAQLQSRTDQLARTLEHQQTAVSDVLSAGAHRYPTQRGEIVRSGDRLYVAMYNLPAAPRGHVYQAWTIQKGSKTIAPSLTFVPDARGVAVVPLPVSATATAAVALSVEPEGGSKQPTTKPLFVVKLD